MLWWFCANLQFADKLDSGGSSGMWVASCPSRWSLYWPLGLIVDHRSLSFIPTERQALACESISWVALWAEPFSFLKEHQTHKLGRMVGGANLQLKDKLEAPQVGTSGPSQQRHSRRYYQNPNALHCTARSDNDTTVVHWVKWKVLRQWQCKCVPLHTRQVVQCTSYVAVCNALLCRGRMCSMIAMSGSYLPDWDFNKFDKCQRLIFNQTEYRWIFAITAESIWIQAQLCLRLKVCWTGEKASQARAYLHPISLLDFQQLWLGKWRVGNPNRNLGSKTELDMLMPT